MAAPGGVRAFFINDSGSLAFVQRIDNDYAHLQIVRSDGGSTAYAMPLREYDSTFVKSWRPATVADLKPLEGEGFRLPANAPPEWREDPTP